MFVGRSAILWVCVVLASSANAGSWEGQEIVKDGVRHVMNPADGIEPPMTIRLNEQWRIGEEDGEDGVMFGLIRGLTVDEEGRFIRQATLLGEGDPFRDRYYFYGDRLYVVSCFAGAMAMMVGGGEKENKFSSMCTDPMSVVRFEITR